jgi:hypothetical protein
MHWQAVLPTLGPLVPDIRVQLTQVLLLTITLSAVEQMQALLLNTNPLGQLQVKLVELHTKLGRQTQVLPVTDPVV